MLIGLCGAAGAGKNAVAEILRDRRNFTGLSFAAPIYRAVSAIVGLSVEELARRDRKERPIGWLGKSPRELLQTLGTQWGRQMVAEDIWVRLAISQARELRSIGGRVAITDVRFENEARAIRGDGGVIWRVTRPVAVLDAQAAQHASEAGIPDDLVDDEVVNDGGLYDLAAAVEAAFARLPAGTMVVAS